MSRYEPLEFTSVSSKEEKDDDLELDLNECIETINKKTDFKRLKRKNEPKIEDPVKKRKKLIIPSLDIEQKEPEKEESDKEKIHTNDSNLVPVDESEEDKTKEVEEVKNITSDDVDYDDSEDSKTKTQKSEKNEEEKEKEKEKEKYKETETVTKHNLKVYTDGTFYIEGRTLDIIKRENKIVGIRVNALLLNTMASTVTPKPKSKRKTKKGKKGKKAKDPDEEQGMEVDEPDQEKNEEENKKKEVEEEEPKSEEQKKSRKKRGEYSDIYEGEYTIFAIYGAETLELTSPFNLMTLAIKKKNEYYELIEIFKVNTFPDLTIKKAKQIIKKLELFKKNDPRHGRFKKTMDSFKKSIYMKSKCNGLERTTQDVKLTDEAIEEVFKNNFEFKYLFTNCFKSPEYFEALELLGIKVVKKLKDKEIYDLIHFKEEDTISVIKKIAFSGRVKEKGRNKLKLEDETYEKIFEAGDIYNNLQDAIFFGHTCYLESSNRRWSYEALEIIKEKAGEYNYRVCRLPDSPLNYIEPNAIDILQKRILDCLLKYERKKLVSDLSNNSLRLLHIEFDDVSEKSEYVKFILSEINQTRRKNDISRKKIVTTTIFTVDNRYAIISKLLGNECNVTKISDFIKNCDVTLRELGLIDEKNNRGQTTIKNRIATEISSNAKTDYKLHHVFIDRCHLLELNIMSDLLFYIDVFAGDIAGSITLIGNANYVPPGQGCPFKDIIDAHRVDVNTISIPSSSYGFPDDKILKPERGYIFTSCEQLTKRIARESKDKLVTFVFNKKANDPTLIEYFQKIFNPLFKWYKINDIRDSGFVDLLIIDVTNMNKNDLQICNSLLTVRGKVIIYGATELELSRAYNKSWYKMTSLKHIAKKRFSNLAKSVQDPQERSEEIEEID